MNEELPFEQFDLTPALAVVPDCHGCSGLKLLVKELEKNYHDLLFDKVFKNGDQPVKNDECKTPVRVKAANSRLMELKGEANGDSAPVLLTPKKASVKSLANILPSVLELQRLVASVSDDGFSGIECADSWDDIVSVIRAACDVISRQKDLVETEKDHEDLFDDCDIMASQCPDPNWIEGFADAGRSPAHLPVVHEEDDEAGDDTDFDMVEGDDDDDDEEFAHIQQHLDALSSAFSSWNDRMALMKRKSLKISSKGKKMNSHDDSFDLHEFETALNEIHEMIRRLGPSLNILTDARKLALPVNLLELTRSFANECTALASINEQLVTDLEAIKQIFVKDGSSTNDSLLSIVSSYVSLAGDLRSKASNVENALQELEKLKDHNAVVFSSLQHAEDINREQIAKWASERVDLLQQITDYQCEIKKFSELGQEVTENASNTIDELKDTANRLSLENRELKNRLAGYQDSGAALSSIRSQLEAKSFEFSDAQAELEKAYMASADLSSKCSSLSEVVHQKTNEIELLLGKQREMESSIAEVTRSASQSLSVNLKEIAQLQQENAELNLKLGKLQFSEQEIANLKIEHDSVVAKFEKEKANLEEWGNMHCNHAEVLDTELNNLMSRTQNLECQLSDKQDTIFTLQAEFQAQSAILKDTAESLARTQSCLDTATANNADLGDKIKHLEGLLNDRSCECDQLLQELESRHAISAEQSRKLSAASAEITNSRMALSNISEKFDALKASKLEATEIAAKLNELYGGVRDSIAKIGEKCISQIKIHDVAHDEKVYTLKQHAEKLEAECLEYHQKTQTLTKSLKEEQARTAAVQVAHDSVVEQMEHKKSVIDDLTSKLTAKSEFKSPDATATSASKRRISSTKPSPAPVSSKRSLDIAPPELSGKKEKKKFKTPSKDSDEGFIATSRTILDESPFVMEKENQASQPSSTPATSVAGRRSSRRAKAVVVAFSGFRDENPEYNIKVKEDLVMKLKALGASVKLDGEFEDSITHVITPPGSRTLKCFAASLTSKWIITDVKWVMDSAGAGKFLDETKYGTCYTENPFKDKSYFLADSFIKESKNGREFRVENAKNLICVIGKGTVVDNLKDAQYVLRGSSDTTKYHGKVKYTWGEFLDLMPISKKN
eukprot:Partr_v1_DN27875_c0_g1_i1_m22670